MGAEREAKSAGANGTGAARLDALLETMHAAADAARAITVPRFRESLAVDDKGGADGLFDPVTSADRDAESAIRELLSAAWPEIGFVGEESAPSALPAGRAWVVDPIDGTRSFVAGIPLWGTLIALHEDGAVPLGLLDQPVLGERYVGRPGSAHLHSGASLRRLAARTGRPLAEAVLCCTTPEMFGTVEERAAFERVREAARLTRYGTDCHAYAQLAAGRVDLVVESALEPWDVQALVPLVRGAGGLISDWDGAEPTRGGRVVAAGSAALHAEALARLARDPG